MTGFRKGMTVEIAVHAAGLVSHEDGIVAKVSKGQVWLDNGPGNDPSGPYDAKTGRRDFDFGLGYQVISPKKGIPNE